LVENGRINPVEAQTRALRVESRIEDEREEQTIPHQSSGFSNFMWNIRQVRRDIKTWRDQDYVRKNEQLG
jgi:hypothetical protein